MTRLERAAFSAILGLLWACMMIQETDLARWNIATQTLADIAIAVASVALWYGLLYFLERLTDERHNGHPPAEIRDSDQCQRR